MNNVGDSLKQDCCGCSLCQEVCPKNAIVMNSDKEGFRYPEVDKSLCVECGICVKMCPFHKPEGRTPKRFIIAKSNDIQVRINSASGGIYTHLSDVVLNDEGVTYGASYNDEFKVIHTRAETAEGRNKHRDSKYVQSSLSGIYIKIKDDLCNGKRVLFSGTPCQCAAVNSYINQKKIPKENLILVDIICHGVSSPMVWSDYVDYVANKYNISHIHSIVTRNKQIGSDYNLTFTSSTMQSYCKEGHKDPFISMFCKNYLLRPSCFNCPYKSMHRITDVTIGDFQKVKEFYPEYDDNRGVSIVMINNDKGQTLFEQVSHNLTYHETNEHKASQINLYEPVMPIAARNRFFKFYLKNGLKSSLILYTEEGLHNRIVGTIKRAVKFLLTKIIHQ